MRKYLSLATLLLALLGSATVTGAASGAVSHPLLNAGPGVYEDACGIALHGGQYVSDYYHDSIVGPSNILGEDPGDGPCKLAFDASGDLYVNNWHQNVVKFTPPFGVPTVIDSAEPTGVTVNQATGHVFVVHRTYVAEYASTGSFIRDIGSGGSLENAFGIAVSEFPATEGYLYVPDAASDTVKVFNPASDLVNPVSEMTGVATPAGKFVYLVDGEVEVDNSPTSPSYGHIFVLDSIGHGKSVHPTAAFDEFNAQGYYRGQITGFTNAEPSGIAIDPTKGVSNGNVSITSGNSEGSAVFTYGPTALAHTLKIVKTGTGGGQVTALPVGINCGEECLAEYDQGQTVTLFTAPDAHSIFSGWTVTGSEPCPGTATCNVVLGSDVEVHASFTEPTQETLTVTSTGEGNVTSVPGGIVCPGVCSEHFSQGRVVTLTGHPAAHHRIIGWSGCIVQPNPSECKATMSAAGAVSVEFGPTPQRTLSIQRSGGGQGTVTSFPAGISCPGACQGSFDEASKVIVVAAPAPVSEFSGFTGGGCTGTSPVCELMMTSNQSLTASFGSVSQSRSADLQSTASLTVKTIAVEPNSALLRVVAPEAGTVLVGGPRLRSSSTTVDGGPALIRATLDQGRVARHAVRRRRLRVRLTIGFIPVGAGNATSATQLVTFGHRARRNGK